MGAVVPLRAVPDAGHKAVKPARGRGRRNVNGEGSIRQRSDGRWEARAYVYTSDGREVRRSIYGRSWDEVHTALTKLQSERQAGKRFGSPSATVESYLKYWLEDVVRHRVRDTTFDGYEYLIRMYLIPIFGRYKLNQLRAADVRRGLHRLKTTCQCCARARIWRGGFERSN
jgi:hypothetical protein